MTLEELAAITGYSGKAGVSKVECEANSAIGNKAPEAGKYPFKKFKGRYPEKELLTQWNLYSDEVKSDMTLYPRYEMI